MTGAQRFWRLRQRRRLVIAVVLAILLAVALAASQQADRDSTAHPWGTGPAIGAVLALLLGIRMVLVAGHYLTPVGTDLDRRLLVEILTVRSMPPLVGHSRSACQHIDSKQILARAECKGREDHHARSQSIRNAARSQSIQNAARSQSIQNGISRQLQYPRGASSALCPGSG